MSWKLVNPNITNDPSYLEPRLNDDESKINTNAVRLSQIASNVKTLGATGDGVVDDTTVIQNAFNLARDNGSAKLYFPEGTYNISNYIQVYKNTTVILHPNAVIKRIGTYYKMFVNGKLGLPDKLYVTGGGYTGEGNIHFVGGTFDLNCQVGNTSGISPTQTVTFFDLGHAENISFDGITVKNGQIGHYFQVSSCKNVRFENCWFGAINYTGSGVSDYDYECIQIEVATVDSFPDFGAYDLTISRDIFIENCTFDTVIRAVGTHSDAMYGTANTIFCENLKFINNKIINSYDHSINLTGERYATVKNNLIVGSADYGMKLYKVEDSVIEGNTILNTQRAGIYLDTSPNNVVKDNVIKEVSLTTEAGKVYSGIRVVASPSCIFDDNTVTAGTPKYSYALYTSDGCPNTRLKGYKFTRGLSGSVGGEFTMSNNLTWVSVGDSITRGNNSDATYSSGVAQGYYQDHALPLMPKVSTHYNRGYGGYCAYIPPNNTTGSITAGTKTLTVASATGFAVNGYANIVNGKADGTNFSSKITAISGTTITLTDNAPMTVTNANIRNVANDSIHDLSNLFEVADIYTVFLGTNDFSRNVPVGSYASASGATDDFYGGLKQLYVDLTTKNMTAIIILVTPLKRLSGENSTIAWDSANTAGFKLVDYVNAIKDFGSNYGCPVLDLFNESGISNRTASTMLYDNLHPYLDTNKRIGRMIANKINMYI